MGLASRSCEGLAVIWTRKVEFVFFPDLTWSWSGKLTEFWWRPFFLRSPNFAGKTVSILVKTLFLFFMLEIIWFWQKNRPNLTQDWWKFWSRSFNVVSSFQKSPPPPLRIPGYAPASTRGGVLVDVLGLENVLEDLFWSPWLWPRSLKSSKM